MVSANIFSYQSWIYIFFRIFALYVWTSSFEPAAIYGYKHLHNNEEQSKNNLQHNNKLKK